MYDRILVPTDGSAGTRRAIDHALRLAEAHGSTLHGLYVVNTASYASFSMETAWEGIGDMLHDEGDAAVAKIRSLAEDAGVPVAGSPRDRTPKTRTVT